MIIDINYAKRSLGNYSNKNDKISRDIKNGKLFRITRGLYETDENTPGYLLAGSIYGPSYISFDYALSYHGLIPERVETVTCATCNKKKKKKYNTRFGFFTYMDVPMEAYPEELLLKTEDGYSYQIASAEKALCDKLYSLKPLNNQTNLETMLFDDLRIDREEFSELDISVIDKLSRLYHSTNVCLLLNYIKRRKQ